MLLKQARSFFLTVGVYLPVLIIIFFFPVNFVSSQQTHPDTLAIDEEEQFTLPEDTNVYTQDFLPEDIIFIPSDVLYDHSWDNVNVRLKKEDLSNMEDTVDIILHNPSESPFVFPKPGKFLSPFGYRGRHFHAGVDLKLNLGDTVLAAFDGKVRLAKRYRGYGNVVVIRHFNGLETVYAHLSKILVSVNQDVKGGEMLGLGGHTGRATANHLHFETRFLGEPFNPETFINFENFCTKSDTLRVTGSLFERIAKGKKAKNRTKRQNSHVASSVATSDFYTVRKGDTLGKIAKKTNTSVKELCKNNRLTSRSILKPGKRLKLN